MVAGAATVLIFIIQAVLVALIQQQTVFAVGVGGAGVLGTRIKEGTRLAWPRSELRGAEAHGSGQCPLACFVTCLPPCPRRSPAGLPLSPEVRQVWSLVPPGVSSPETSFAVPPPRTACPILSAPWSFRETGVIG